MLILLFVIFVALFILGSIFIDDYNNEGLKVIVQICTVLGAAVTLICIVCTTYNYSKTRVIDTKIEMYIEENTNIENQIDTIVSNYMGYEKETFIELKDNDAVTLVSLYPELQSDELVKAQIATYQANNAKLKELKELKIDATVHKWWLYFGK